MNLINLWYLGSTAPLAEGLSATIWPTLSWHWAERWQKWPVRVHAREGNDQPMCRDRNAPKKTSPCAFWGWRCARQSVAISPQAHPVATECIFFTIEWSQHNPKNCKFSHYRMVSFFQARLHIRLHKTALKRGARLCWKIANIISTSEHRWNTSTPIISQLRIL